MRDGSLVVAPVAGAAGRKQFIRAADAAYQGDPHYVRPLEFEVAGRLNPDANPTLMDAPHQLWIATRGGETVGRIAAIVNPAHLARHQDDCGHFGFLDAIDDPAVFAALLAAAEEWLRSRGMKRIAGPFNFSVNEEVGMLVEGFDAPPYVLMPHGRPWYAPRVEALGYAKAMDMLALSWENRLEFMPAKRKRFVERALSNPRVSMRNLDFKRFKDDIRIVVDIFNDAWSDNWGFIPFTEAHVNHMASELRPIIEKHNVVICHLDDEPVAFCLVLPNINQLIKDFDGKLLPFNWAKLLWRLKVKGATEARMPLMGVRKKLQGKPIGVAFAYKLIDLTNTVNMERGLQSSELSWILEDNHAMLNMLYEMGGKPYKRYRVYEKAL